MPSPKFVGRGTVLEYSIAPPTATVGALVWSVLGAVRAKTWTGSWDSTDATADDSTGRSKESLVSFRGVEFSCDGVSYGETVSGQKALESHFNSPGAGTNYEPQVWFRLTDPDGTMRYAPFLLTELTAERPHADAATWSLSATGNGQPTYTPT